MQAEDADEPAPPELPETAPGPDEFEHRLQRRRQFDLLGRHRSGARHVRLIRRAIEVATAEGSMKLEGEIMRTVDKQLGAIGRPSRVFFVTLLPKTRSGKIMRRLLRVLAKGEEITQDTSTLENPAILEQLKEAL